MVQKTKLNSAEIVLERENRGQLKEFDEFLQNLSAVDFNNRGEESKYK